MGIDVTDVGNEKKSGKHELKKHAASIHCSNTLSLLQRKISNALLFNAYKELLIKEEHEISIRQLCNLISYSGNNHAVIKEALKGLLSTVIEWNLVNDTTGNEDWTASSILASVSLQGPVCYYAYSPRMKHLLHSPSMFGKINLYIQSRFKSSYGLALYENCIRYRGLPHTKWFEIELFRKMMGVTMDNYPIFRDFKRRVLDKSVEEVNTYSDLLVEPELLRERRQVVRIRFILKERAKKTRLGSLVNEEETKNDEDLHAKLIMQFHLSPKQVQNVLRDYNEEFILAKIAVVESSPNFQRGKIKNIAAYFRSALKNDYQVAKTSEERMKEKKAEEQRTRQNLQTLKRLAEEVEKAYLVYREETIDQSVSQLLSDEKNKLMDAFYQYAATPIRTILKLQRKRYTKATILKSPQVKALLREFVLRTIPTLHSTLMTIEKFVDQFSENHRNAWYQFKLIEAHEKFI
jgi:plasmid replication initiation protein